MAEILIRGGIVMLLGIIILAFVILPLSMRHDYGFTYWECLKIIFTGKD